MKIKAKVRKVDDELNYRVTDISYGDGIINGPTRSIGYGLNQANSIAESYSVFDKARIEEIVSDADLLRNTEGDMKRKRAGDALNLSFVSYTQPTPLNDDELNAMINLQYVCSDVAITPCWSGLMKGKVDDKVVDRLNEWNSLAIEAIERKNNKSIMGVIPVRVHHTRIKDVVKNYVDQDVTLFAIDQMGRSVKNSEAWLRELYYRIDEYKLMDSTVVYGMNIMEGRMVQKKEKVLAGDFIGSAFGLDVIGHNHVGLGRPSPPGKAGIKPPEISYRLFDASSYAYRKISERKAHTMFRVVPSKVREEVKRRNITTQLEEFSNLGQVLAEESSALKYIRTKEMVDSDLISSIKRVKGEGKARQAKLFN